MNPDWYSENEKELEETAIKFASLMYEKSNSMTGVELMQWVVDYVEDFTSHEQFKNISCTRGCSFCCHDKIILSKFEADYLKHVLKDKIKPNKEFLKVQNSVPEFNQLLWAQKRCSLLGDEGQCTIYEDRPLVCRLYNSTGNPVLCVVDGNGENEEHGQIFSLNTEALMHSMFLISNLESTTLHELLNTM